MMRNKPRRFDLNPDHFIAGVAGQLDAVELGVYWLLSLLVYSNCGPVEYDERRFVSMLPGTHWRSFRAAFQRLLELGKVTSEDGHVMVKGCSGPLHEAFKRVSEATDNGLKGGRPSNKNSELAKPPGFSDEKLLPPPPPVSTFLGSPESKPNLSETGVSDPSKASHPPKSGKNRIPYPEAFEAFWREYPTDRLMSKKTAFERWKRLSEEDRAAARAAIPAFRDHCRKNPTYRPVHAERFLSQRRFDGFAGTTITPVSDPELDRIEAIEAAARKARAEKEDVDVQRAAA